MEDQRGGARKDPGNRNRAGGGRETDGHLHEWQPGRNRQSKGGAADLPAMGPGESDQGASGQTFHQLHARVRERGYEGAAAGEQSTGDAVEEEAWDSAQ